MRKPQRCALQITTPFLSPGSGSRPPILLSLESDGNWLPWYWRAWQPGTGEPLNPGATIDAVVEANDVCVFNLRAVWDARSSCRRYLVSVPSAGRLRAWLRWDTSAPGFDESLAGGVVFVARDGRFASSDWQRSELDVCARVEPGDYTVLVITYVPASLHSSSRWRLIEERQIARLPTVIRSVRLWTR